MELINDPVISQWIETANVKPNTRNSYLMGMQKYLEFTGLTPEELLNEAESENIHEPSIRKRKILTRRLAFRKHLIENTELSPNSVRNMMNGIKSFYKSAYLSVPELPRMGTIEPQPENIAFITKDEIREILNVADPLEKAIVLVGVSSGLAAADICNLKVGNFKNGYDDKTKITMLQLTRIKTGVKFVTFLSPEASTAVWNYLKYRDRQPKRRTKERLDETEKQHVTRDEGYLFIVRHVRNRYLDIPLNETDKQWKEREDIRKIDENVFSHIYAKLAEKCQKCSIKGWSIVRSHNMRKFFNSTLLNAGLEYIFVDYMMGHKPDAVDGAYANHDPLKLKERYKEYIPHITITDELNIFENPQYQQLLREHEMLAKETAKIMVDKADYDVLNSKLEEMKMIKDVFVHAQTFENEHIKLAFEAAAKMIAEDEKAKKNRTDKTWT
jgi:site-specific recombinase XerD